MRSGSRGFALESGLLHRFARHNPLLCIKHFRFRAGHHGARPYQDPSGHPPRIGGQGQETVGARRLTPTQRAARSMACRAAHRLLRVPTSLNRQLPPIRKFGPAATARPRGRARRATRGSPSDANNVKSMIARLDREPRSTYSTIPSSNNRSHNQNSPLGRSATHGRKMRGGRHARHRLALRGGLSTCDSYPRLRLRLGVSSSR
jgi:hypothetical protein